MKKLTLILAMMVLSIGAALAQRTVTGTVTDAKGEALIGASVFVRGTTTGVVTDVDGSFSLSLPTDGNTLIVSYTGFETLEVPITASNLYNITLREGVVLEELVVTALGIKREKKALGYASTTVSASEIAEKPETDVARALIGRAPGINITNSSGIAGSGTKINIRGTSTITGNSQPLWIVDGVPINTAANENNSFEDGNVTPTRNLDIDPNNIASVSVLRGLSATTLYGAQGRNGVILITTKTGAGVSGNKFSASVSQAYNVIDAFVPEYQNDWANGFDGDYGEFFSNWGSLFDGEPRGRHPYFEHRATFPDNPEFAEGTNYVPQAYPDNVKDFFQQGTSLTTSVNAGISGDIGSFNVSFSRTGEEGYIKNNELERLNFSIGGVANLTKKLSFNANFSFVQTDFKTPPIGAGQGSNSAGGPSVFANLFYTPRNIDLNGWPYQNPFTGANVYYRNNNSITHPRWVLDNARQSNNTDRFLSVMAANYKLTDWVTLTYRLGIDTYTEEQEYFVNKGSVGYAGSESFMANGVLRTTIGKNTIYDQSVILSGGKSITDKIDFTANFGVNARQDLYDQNGLESQNQVVFGLSEHRNFILANSRDFRGNNLNSFREQVWLGAFFDATFGYNSYLYLNVQGRNDWASTHEKEYRSLFYPGASISFVPTDAFDGLANSNVLSFLKVRLGYGTSANFATPYRTRPFLTLNSNASVDAIGNVITLGLPSLLANPDLEPELQREIEGGLEARFFKDRFGIDLSLYRRVAEGQIVQRPLDPSTGFTNTFINAGTISNEGIELSLSITPIRTDDFSWNLRGNFTKNVSLVEELPEGSKEILISGYTDLGNFAVEGEPFGVIKGTFVEKNENGDLLINSNGDWKISSEIGIIGDPNPDFLISGFTDLNFKGVTIGAQLDYVQGGDLFSYSAGTLIGRGVAKELEGFNPELPVVLPGVLEETGEVNNIPQPASGVFFNNTIIGGGASDRGIYDGTRLRLREVYLTYALPSALFTNSFVKGINISLNANNIWFRAFNTPKFSKVDPDRTAFGTDNGLGFDFLGGPSARRMGVNVKVNF
ncbi:MAG: SusC/RagA family TonB-linked outer membrane protein [Saprospiraceae bacterium]|nr:SusC/RagA family TonB-linked outer membrane protein [Saprospiraceae bacterium]